MVIGHWSLVIGHWSFVICHLSFVICHWSFVEEFLHSVEAGLVRLGRKPNITLMVKPSPTHRAGFAAQLGITTNISP
ncbi:hypothetical protein [Coleofasciculus sp. E1-EBD-02]|uniref:hypothetical protein n=1 Tax=Coleofasciculus sp. E1-EBD-02 TaxID=3068481 RepID=UPI0032FEC122